MESTFPTEIPLHFTVCGIISDLKTMKQELCRLSNAPQQIRVLALLSQFMKSRGVLVMLNSYWVHEILFVCHLPLPTNFDLSFNH